MKKIFLHWWSYFSIGGVISPLVELFLHWWNVVSIFGDFIIYDRIKYDY
jgi:hypothetical protein